MTEDEQHSLRMAGYPLDGYAEKSRMTLQEVERSITWATGLIKLFDVFRFKPNWPNERSIRSCVRAMERELHVRPVPSLSLVVRANNAISRALERRQRHIPYNENGRRIDEAMKLHAEVCTFIRGRLKLPAE